MENKLRENIDLLIEDFIEEVNTPGIVIGVIEKGELVYSKGFGVQDIETKEPVTENTIFNMASVSKTFVAASIMQLVEKGKVKLHDPIIKHLPYFKIKGAGYETITIRELLTHTSGMPMMYDLDFNNPEDDDKALERHIRNISNCELLTDKRGGFKYSDLAFEVLGDLISKVSGVSFETYVKENIFNPIGMKESTFLNREINKELLATPHCLDISNGYNSKVSKVFPYNRKYAPSSCLCSNIVDMFKWAKVNLNKGTIDGVQILKEESYSELFKAVTSTGRGGYGSDIGLSWFLGQHKGTKVAGHSGSNIGFLSNFLILPEKQLGLILMTNCDFARMKLLSESLLDILLGYEDAELKHALATVLLKTLLNEGIESANEKYNFIKENCKDKYFNEESGFNDFADFLSEENKINEAIALLEIAIKELPNCPSLYEKLGANYLKTGNKEMAIKNYEISVELYPQNRKAIDMLKDLRAK